MRLNRKKLVRRRHKISPPRNPSYLGPELHCRSISFFLSAGNARWLAFRRITSMYTSRSDCSRLAICGNCFQGQESFRRDFLLWEQALWRCEQSEQEFGGVLVTAWEERRDGLRVG